MSGDEFIKVLRHLFSNPNYIYYVLLNVSNILSYVAENSIAYINFILFRVKK
jgi:hypothetical protein